MYQGLTSKQIAMTVHALFIDGVVNLETAKEISSYFEKIQSLKNSKFNKKKFRAIATKWEGK
jgi:hypothetical protein